MDWREHITVPLQTGNRWYFIGVTCFYSQESKDNTVSVLAHDLYLSAKYFFKLKYTFIY